VFESAHSGIAGVAGPVPGESLKEVRRDDSQNAACRGTPNGHGVSSGRSVAMALQLLDERGYGVVGDGVPQVYGRDRAAVLDGERVLA
jgi:hypothetical protein